MQSPLVIEPPAAPDRSSVLVELPPQPPTPDQPRALNRAGTAGRVLLLLAAILLLFVGFEVSVTSLAEQRAQAALLPELRAAIKTTILDRETSAIAPGAAVALLEIPSIGLQQVVVEGTTPSDLKSGPGHLPGSSVPGEFGNAVILGRRTTYGSPFGSLASIRKGQTIKAVTGQGLFTYRVTSVRHVAPGQADPVMGTTDSRITLVTSDPAFLATGRLAVVAMLQGKQVAVPQRPPVPLAAGELGLSGDALGLGLGIIWGELLLLSIWAVWRLRNRWPRGVVYLLGAPVVLTLLVLTFSSVDLLLPSTL